MVTLLKLIGIRLANIVVLPSLGETKWRQMPTATRRLAHFWNGNFRFV